MTTVLTTQQRAARVALREERTRDAALAIREYLAENLANRANAARLRAVRVAKEAEKRPPAKKLEPAKKKRKLS